MNGNASGRACGGDTRESAAQLFSGGCVMTAAALCLEQKVFSWLS